MLVPILLLIVGLLLLVLGAELLVRGASALARAVGIPALIIGLTVVAYGTSAPELAVSTTAGLQGNPDIALGNVVGSNTFNVLLILGLSALVAPLIVSSQLVRLDVPVMIGASLVSWLFAADGQISRLEGLGLALGAIVYTVLLIQIGRRTASPAELEPEAPPSPANRRPAGWLTSLLLIVAGLALLVLGARWLVDGSVQLARMIGVSDLLIGLTIVSGGTSLPELATSVVASLRKQRDIAIGNVVGSNIFNLLAVLGTSAAISGSVGVAESALRFDLPVMVAVAVVCLPIFFTGGRISRWEGALFLGSYVAYVGYLILVATGSSWAPTLGSAMVAFVLPATALGIGLSVVYTLRQRQKEKGLPR